MQKRILLLYITEGNAQNGDMVKAISKIGNSYGIIFDASVLEMAGLKNGDSVNVEVGNGGVITLTPMKAPIKPAKAAATATRLIRKNSDLFRRLA